jgi:hypothetical protein
MATAGCACLAQVSTPLPPTDCYHDDDSYTHQLSSLIAALLADANYLRYSISAVHHHYQALAYLQLADFGSALTAFNRALPLLQLQASNTQPTFDMQTLLEPAQSVLVQPGEVGCHSSLLHSFALLDLRLVWLPIQVLPSSDCQLVAQGVLPLAGVYAKTFMFHVEVALPLEDVDEQRVCCTMILGSECRHHYLGVQRAGLETILEVIEVALGEYQVLWRRWLLPLLS